MNNYIFHIEVDMESTDKVNRFDFVFYGILTFVGYLMPEPS